MSFLSFLEGQELGTSLTWVLTSVRDRFLNPPLSFVEGDLDEPLQHVLVNCYLHPTAQITEESVYNGKFSVADVASFYAEDKTANNYLGNKILFSLLMLWHISPPCTRGSLTKVLSSPKARDLYLPRFLQHFRKDMRLSDELSPEIFLLFKSFVERDLKAFNGIRTRRLGLDTVEWPTSVIELDSGSEGSDEGGADKDEPRDSSKGKKEQAAKADMPGNNDKAKKKVKAATAERPGSSSKAREEPKGQGKAAKADMPGNKKMDKAATAEKTSSRLTPAQVQTEEFVKRLSAGWLRKQSRRTMPAGFRLPQLPQAVGQEVGNRGLRQAQEVGTQASFLPMSPPPPRVPDITRPAEQAGTSRPHPPPIAQTPLPVELVVADQAATLQRHNSPTFCQAGTSHPHSPPSNIPPPIPAAPANQQAFELLVYKLGQQDQELLESGGFYRYEVRRNRKLLRKADKARIKAEEEAQRQRDRRLIAEEQLDALEQRVQSLEDQLGEQSNQHKEFSDTMFLQCRRLESRAYRIGVQNEQIEAMEARFKEIGQHVVCLREAQADMDAAAKEIIEQHPTGDTAPSTSGKNKGKAKKLKPKPEAAFQDALRVQREVLIKVECTVHLAQQAQQLQEQELPPACQQGELPCPQQEQELPPACQQGELPCPQQEQEQPPACQQEAELPCPQQEQEQPPAQQVEELPSQQQEQEQSPAQQDLAARQPVEGLDSQAC
ncbi:hypothetical protein CEUSTIGMA_g10074.t1 [Chlamydomonas eustigma]|uniref:Uncharacterized protein n=1 Tax=Chlamydomonas eustigma TaxID=1157962 RepID=A0A250XHU8_9CHLO|nr:hypothetical protein CEUSTIGMA_g10074.t1 [Chlamydomonas eustigma]|eukprot:GAX82648.1 hypothetical protein CEUSTIGMA_g10074.t1 [Chlamydomonas eustigma]